jgi:dienelactone hydrolase
VLDGARTVIIQTIDDRSLLAGLKAGNQKIRNLQWAGPNHVLITSSTTGYAMGVISSKTEWSVALSYDIARRRQTDLFQGGDSRLRRMNVVAGPPMARTIGGRTIVFAVGEFFPDHVGRLGLFSIDLEGGATRLVDGDGAEQWVVDETGAPVARAAYDEAKRIWRLEVRQAKGWVACESVTATIERPRLLGVGPMGRAILVADPQGENVKLERFSLDDCSRLGDMGSGDFSRTIEDPVTHRVIGGESVAGAVRYRFFDPADQAVWNTVAGAYPGEMVRLVSWSDDRQRIVIRLDGPADGVSYSLVDLKTHSARRIGDAYKCLTAQDISPVKSIIYAAADGLVIPAYLTLPRGRDPKNLPLIVLPHGGPAVRDDPGFDWWSQALADQGYAVLQPEYRGSSGLGWAHLSAGFGQWGRKMQTDLSDGVRFLVKAGTVDPKRVCIVGASYGGYAALAGAAFDPGVYRCAASISGPADLRRMLAWTRQRAGRGDSSVLRYWDRFMGASDPNDPVLATISPAAHADRITIPILLVHGKDDTVVDYEQSRLMAGALKAAGKTVEFVTLDGEDHWLSREATRIQMLQTLVAFLNENNPPG